MAAAVSTRTAIPSIAVLATPNVPAHSPAKTATAVAPRRRNAVATAPTAGTTVAAAAVTDAGMAKCVKAAVATPSAPAMAAIAAAAERPAALRAASTWTKTRRIAAPAASPALAAKNAATATAETEPRLLQVAQQAQFELLHSCTEDTAGDRRVTRENALGLRAINRTEDDKANLRGLEGWPRQHQDPLCL